MSRNYLQKKVKELGIPLYTKMSRFELESFLDNSTLSLGWRWNLIRKALKGTKYEKHDLKAAVDMLTSPVRNLQNLYLENETKKIKRYLSNHPVIITLTTSPLRLPKILAVLSTLDLTYVTSINITLPEFYGRKKEQYLEIPEEILNFPKVKILRIEKDLGPISKMLPTIQSQKDKKALVISIDDDVCYPLGLVNEMIYQKIVKRPNAIITTGESMPFRSNIIKMRKYWPEKRAPSPYTDIVEGWDSVLYSPNKVNSECMNKLADLDIKCFLSDDFVISYVLAYANIPRYRINNKYAYNPHPYGYGAEADALHAGSGLLEKPESKFVAHQDDINYEKYRDCLEVIVQYAESVRKNRLEPDVCNFRKRKRSLERSTGRKIKRSKSTGKRSKRKSKRKSR